jgi:hypothetical protein
MSIKGGNQFEQFTDESSACQRHRRPPYQSVCDLDAFQTSPQFVHRQ